MCPDLKSYWNVWNIVQNTKYYNTQNGNFSSFHGIKRSSLVRLHYTVETSKRHAGYEHGATQGRREQNGIGDATVKLRRNIHVL